MNSYHKFDTKEARCGFGVHLESQMQNLKNMEDLVNNMTFLPKPGSQKKCFETKPFMEGIK